MLIESRIADWCDSWTFGGMRVDEEDTEQEKSQLSRSSDDASAQSPPTSSVDPSDGPPMPPPLDLPKAHFLRTTSPDSPRNSVLKIFKSLESPEKFNNALKVIEVLLEGGILGVESLVLLSWSSVVEGLEQLHTDTILVRRFLQPYRIVIGINLLMTRGEPPDGWFIWAGKICGATLVAVNSLAPACC